MWSARSYALVDRHKVLSRIFAGVVFAVMYGGAIAFGAYCSATDAIGTNSPWPGAIGVAVAIPIGLLAVHARSDHERDEHEQNYDRQNRW